MLKNGLILKTFRNSQKDCYKKEKSKNVIGLMRDELGGKIMKEFVGLKTKTQSYLIDDNDDRKQAKGTTNCVIIRKL